MLNVIKMDLYRVAKAKSTKVLVIVAVLFAVFAVFMTHFEMTVLSDTPAYQQAKEQAEGMTEYSVGIQVAAPDEWYAEGYKVPAEDIVSLSISSQMILVFIVIFIGVLINGEYKSGFLKSIAGQIPKRQNLILSKLVSLIAFSFVLLLVFFITTLISATLFFGYLNIVSLMNLITLFGIQMLLHVAFGTVIILLATATRSGVATTAVGLCVSTGVGALILMGVTAILSKIVDLKEGFQLSNYTLSTNVGAISYNSPDGDIVRALIVAISFIAVSLISSAIIMKKRDIN